MRQKSYSAEHLDNASSQTGLIVPIKTHADFLGVENMTAITADTRVRGMTAEERKVIVASSAGTVFEWYDFYLAGSLAANIAANFVPGDNETANSFSFCSGLRQALLCAPSARCSSDVLVI